MSANGRAYVEQFSPYRGNAYIIHQKMGDLANDTNDQRLFMGDAKMAALCRCSEKTLQRVRNKMMKDGYLLRVTPAQGRRGAEYQLLFPLVEIGGHNDHATEIGGQSVPNRWTNMEYVPIYRTELNESDCFSISVSEQAKRAKAIIRGVA